MYINDVEELDFLLPSPELLIELFEEEEFKPADVVAIYKEEV